MGGIVIHGLKKTIACSHNLSEMIKRRGKNSCERIKERIASQGHNIFNDMPFSYIGFLACAIKKPASIENQKRLRRE